MNFALVTKSRFIIVLVVIPIIVGSMAVSISSVNDFIHLFDSTASNGQQERASSNIGSGSSITETTTLSSSTSSSMPTSDNNSVSSTSNDVAPVTFFSPEWEMNRVTITTKSSTAPVIGAIVDRSSPSTIDAIKNAVPQIRSYYVSKFDLSLNASPSPSFGITNNNSESQIFLVRTLGPSQDLILEGSNGATAIYHVTYSDKWLVEVKPGVTGTVHLYSNTNSQGTVGIEVERVLSLDQSQFGFAPAITGMAQVTTEQRQQAVTALSVNELSSTHYTWALVNIKDEPTVFLLRLDTTPQLWINLEIIDKSANRVFQYTEEGYFLVEINPYGKGKFQSAVSGSSFTIISEITQIT